MSVFKWLRASFYSALIMALLSKCSNDSPIIFPQIGTQGIIDGYVDPTGVAVKVYLINVVAVDSVTADLNTGYFRFNNVAFGTYKLEAKADSFGTVSTIIKLTSGVYTLGSVSLNRYPSQILSLSPRENSKLDYVRSAYGNDTIIEFCFTFRKPLNRKTFEDNFSVSPELPYLISKETVTDYRHDVYVTMSVIDIFSHPKITFVFNTGISSIYFEPLEFDYLVNYFPDTTKSNEVNRNYFLSSITPSENSNNVNINTDVKIQFKRMMDHKSVEGALRITPEHKYDAFWQSSINGGELLNIRFSELLNKGTLYTVIIDSTAFSKERVKLSRPVISRFSTDLLRCISFSPASKEMYVSLSNIITYNFNFPIDSASFISAFSVTPPLDSLQYLFYENNRTVTILHSDFTPDTSYTIVIDTNLQDYSGKHIVSPIMQTFYTGEADSVIKSKCIKETYPGDTNALVECNENIMLYFTGAMDRASVHERISITPGVPFDLLWLSPSTLQIKQLQSLRSTTKYTVVLDSGYLTLDHMVSGSGHTFQFKTKELRLISYYPLDGQMNVPCDQDIILAFSTPVDTISLLANCFFNPPVDSISCFRDKDGKYHIRHYPFLYDKEYQFKVTDSIADRYGIVSGNSFVINFSIVKQY